MIENVTMSYIIKCPNELHRVGSPFLGTDEWALKVNSKDFGTISVPGLFLRLFHQLHVI